MARPTFYHNGGGEYTALTGEHPRGFPNLFIAFTGPSPSSITETCFPLSVLGDLVEASELPEDWAYAFEGVGIKMPKPTQPQPTQPKHTRGIREEELLTHVALGLDPLTALVASVDDVEPAEYPAWHPVAIAIGAFAVVYLISLALGL